MTYGSPTKLGLAGSFAPFAGLKGGVLSNVINGAADQVNEAPRLSPVP